MEPDRITMKKEKVKVFLEWPASKDVKDIQKFLKPANYYWWFIKNFSRIVKLLHKLVRIKQK